MPSSLVPGPFQVRRAVDLRERCIQYLGDFTDLWCGAKCVARILQAFSDTIFSVIVSDATFIFEYKNDVKRNGRVFSYG
jgi:hypothetical protein